MTETAPATPAPTPLVSQSQVVLFRECQRKWAWKYVVRIADVQGDGARLGDEVDEGQLQPYLSEGREFDFSKESGSGYIAASGLAYLPKPLAAGLEVQRHFVMPSLAGFEPGRPGKWTPKFAFQGYLDMWAPDASIMPDLPPAPPGLVIPLVGDFKTTKDFKYAKDETALRKDVQANLYATWAMWSTGARVVDLVWIYFRTKGARKSQRTHVRVTAEDVVPHFLSINATAEEMFSLRQRAPAEAAELEDFARSLPVNTEMCLAYGGCPYQAQCNLSPAEYVEAVEADARRRAGNVFQITKKENAMSTNAMNLFANLQAMKPAAPTPTPTPTPTPAPTATPAPTPPAAEMKPINPPESALPAAAPIGTVLTPPPAPAAETAVEAPKAARGRPKKDATAAPPAEAIRSAGVDANGETFTVTWAEERFSPVQYNSFGVGPFEVQGKVQPGESLIDAMNRVAATLFAFAAQQRAVHADAFKRALGRGES